MGLLSRFFSKDDPANVAAPEMCGLFIGGTDAGVTVTHHNALSVSPVWRAVQILADAIVGLPIQVKGTDNAKLPGHPIARLLHNDGEANEYMTAVAVKSAMMSNIALWGNGYAYIQRDAAGQPMALYPLPSSQTIARRSNGQAYYVTRVGQVAYTLGAQDVLHILGPLTLDGLCGVSPIEYAKQTIGISIALQKFAAKFFGQGGNIGGIIETPPMKEEAQKNFLDSWRRTYTGPDAAFKIAALTGGMKFHPTTADPKDSQSLESRTFQVREVARIWGIPPHMLGDMEKSSYASIEAQSMDFYQGTIQPYVIRWEAEIARKLLAESEKGRLTVRLNMDAKLRGTTNERYDAYTKGRQGGWLSINDIRRLENMPPIKGGDTYLQPLNMAPTGTPGAVNMEVEK